MAANLPRERLPAHLSYGVTRDGRVFFIDDRLQTTSWLHPLSGKPVQTGHQHVSGLTQGWQQAVTQEGAIYYIDHNTGTTTFDHPSSGPSHAPASPSSPPVYPSFPGSPTDKQIKINSPSKLRPLKAPPAKRDDNAMVTLKGWLYRQESGSWKTWKKRWCVLSNFGLFFYKDDKESHTVGSILLPSYRIEPCGPSDMGKKFAFKAEHNNMKTYMFASDTQEDRARWIEALKCAAVLRNPPLKEKETNNNTTLPKLIPKSPFMTWDDDEDYDDDQTPRLSSWQAMLSQGYDPGPQKPLKAAPPDVRVQTSLDGQYPKNDPRFPDMDPRQKVNQQGQRSDDPRGQYPGSQGQYQDARRPHNSPSRDTRYSENIRPDHHRDPRDDPRNHHRDPKDDPRNHHRDPRDDPRSHHRDPRIPQSHDLRNNDSSVQQPEDGQNPRFRDRSPHPRPRPPGQENCDPSPPNNTPMNRLGPNGYGDQVRPGEQDPYSYSAKHHKHPGNRHSDPRHDSRQVRQQVDPRHEPRQMDIGEDPQHHRDPRLDPLQWDPKYSPPSNHKDPYSGRNVDSVPAQFMRKGEESFTRKGDSLPGHYNKEVSPTHHLNPYSAVKTDGRAKDISPNNSLDPYSGRKMNSLPGRYTRGRDISPNSDYSDASYDRRQDFLPQFSDPDDPYSGHGRMEYSLGSRSQDPGSRSHDQGSRLQDPGSRSQDPGSRSQNPGSRSQDPGSRSQDPGSMLQDHGYREGPNQRYSEKEEVMMSHRDVPQHAKNRPSMRDTPSGRSSDNETPRPTEFQGFYSPSRESKQRELANRPLPAINVSMETENRVPHSQPHHQREDTEDGYSTLTKYQRRKKGAEPQTRPGPRSQHDLYNQGQAYPQQHDMVVGEHQNETLHTYVNLPDRASLRDDGVDYAEEPPDRPPLPTAVRQQIVEEIAQARTPRTSEEILEAERALETRMQQPSYFNYPTPVFPPKEPVVFDEPSDWQQDGPHIKGEYSSHDGFHGNRQDSQGDRTVSNQGYALEHPRQIEVDKRRREKGRADDLSLGGRGQAVACATHDRPARSHENMSFGRDETLRKDQLLSGRHPYMGMPNRLDITRIESADRQSKEGPLSERHTDGHRSDVHTNRSESTQVHLDKNRTVEGHLDKNRTVEGHLDKNRTVEGHLDKNRTVEGHLDKNRTVIGHLDKFGSVQRSSDKFESAGSHTDRYNFNEGPLYKRTERKTHSRPADRNVPGIGPVNERHGAKSFKSGEDQYKLEVNKETMLIAEETSNYANMNPLDMPYEEVRRLEVSSDEDDPVTRRREQRSAFRPPITTAQGRDSLQRLNRLMATPPCPPSPEGSEVVTTAQGRDSLQHLNRLMASPEGPEVVKAAEPLGGCDLQRAEPSGVDLRHVEPSGGDLWQTEPSGGNHQQTEPSGGDFQPTSDGDCKQNLFDVEGMEVKQRVSNGMENMASSRGSEFRGHGRRTGDGGRRKPDLGPIHTVKEDPDMADEDVIETRGVPNVGKKYMLSGGRIRMSISAGDLIGKTHDELVLLLIQLRREHADLEKERNYYREMVDQRRTSEQRYRRLLQESDGPFDQLTEMDHYEYMQLRGQLDDAEKRLEVYRPMVNLVHNMVNMGSLYGGDNFMLASQYRKHLLSPEEITPPKKMLEFSRKHQEEQIVHNIQEDIKHLSTDEVILEDKLERLYELDHGMHEQSYRVTQSQEDKELLEKALQGILRQQDMSRDNPREQDQLIHQQRTIEKEISRVMYQLAKASRDLEETTAENNKIEHEVALLRSKLTGEISRSKSAPSLSDERIRNKLKMEKDLAEVKDIMAGLNQQGAELSVAMNTLRRSSAGAKLASAFTKVDQKNLHKPVSVSTYMETDLDSAKTTDLSQVQEILLAHCNGTQASPTVTIKSQPLMVAKHNMSQENSPDQTHGDDAPWDISDADDNTKRFFGLIPKDKPKTLTVRDVKRQSGQRKEQLKVRKDDDGEPWSYNDVLSDQTTGPIPPSFKSVNQGPIYENLPPSDMALRKTWSSVNAQGTPGSAANSRRSSALHLMMPRPFVPFGSPPTSNRTSYSSLNIDNQSKTSGSYRLGPSDDDSYVKATRVIIQPQLEPSNEGISPPRQGMFSMKRTPRGRYMTISSSEPVKLETTLVQPSTPNTAAGDLIINRSIPDIVQSSRTRDELMIDTGTIDKEILFVPDKVLIPDRYNPESDPEDESEEDKQRRQEKAEKIKKLLAQQSVHSISQPDVSQVAGELHKKVEQEKVKRAELLQVGQELARQVTLKTRQAAAERRKTWSGSPSKSPKEREMAYNIMNGHNTDLYRQSQDDMYSYHSDDLYGQSQLPMQEKLFI